MEQIKESEYNNHNIIVTSEYKNDKKSLEDNIVSYEDTIEFKKIKQSLDNQNLIYVTDTIKDIFKLNTINKMSYFEESSKEEYYGYGGKRVIIYVRLSQEDLQKTKGNVSNSIVNQLILLLPYCEEHELKIVGIFYEEDISGSDENREEWKKSLKFCELRHTDIYLCKTQSRFARDVEFIERYLHKKFIEWNVRFISPVDGSDTNEPDNKLKRQFTAILDENKLAEQSNNTRKTLRGKNAAGQWTASFTPYGYIKDPKDKYHLIIDEPAAKVVRKIYDLFLEGYSYGNIALYLNENNIPTPSRYKKLNGSKFYCRFAVNGSPYWSPQTVKKILVDETYDGVLIQHRTEKIAYNIKGYRKIPRNEQIIVACTHERIISPEVSKIVRQKFAEKKANLELTRAKREARNLINLVETILNKKNSVEQNTRLTINSLLENLKDKYLLANIKDLISSYNELRNYIMTINETFCSQMNKKTIALQVGKGRTRACKDGKAHIFSQKVACQCCGRNMTKKQYKTAKDGIKEYLYCKTKKSAHGYTCENKKSIKFEELSSIVLKELNKQIKKYYNENELETNCNESEIYSSINKDITALRNEQEQLTKRINKNKELFTSLYEDKANGIITTEEFIMLRDNYNTQNERYEQRINSIISEISSLSEKINNRQKEKKIFEKYKHLDVLTKEIIDTFISKIIIGKYDEETKQRTIKIVWNYSI